MSKSKLEKEWIRIVVREMMKVTQSISKKMTIDVAKNFRYINFPQEMTLIYLFVMHELSMSYNKKIEQKTSSTNNINQKT